MRRNRLTRDPSGISCSKPLVPPVKLLLPPTVPNRPFFLFAPLFLSLCLSPAFHKEISRLDRLQTTIANSVNSLHPRFCLSSCAFPFSKVDRCRHLIVSKGNLALL